METVKLAVKRRELGSKGALRALRQAGRLPAVIYGRGKDPARVSLDAAEFRSILGRGANALLQVCYEEPGEKREKHFAVITEVQRHPTKPMILHVDLHEVDLNQEIEAPVPIELVGKPKGLEVGGIVDQLLHEVHVRALPEHIPHSLSVDISALGVGQHITVAGLPASAEYQILTDPGEAVASVLAPRLPQETVGEGEEAVTEES